MSNIDEIFKKGLDGKGMEYSDASWASMEQVLNTKKVGFFGRYKLLLGLGSLLLVSSIAFVCFEKLESNTATNTPTVANNSSESEAYSSADELTKYNDGIKTTDYQQSNDPKYVKNWTPAVSNGDNSGSRIVNEKRSNAVIGSSGREANSINNSAISTLENISIRTAQPIRDVSVPSKISEESGVVIISDKTEESLPLSVVTINTSPTLKQETLIKKDFAPVVTTLSKSLSSIDYKLGTKSLDKMDFLPNPNKKKARLYLSPYAGYVNYEKSVVLPVSLRDENNNLGNSETQSSWNYGINVGLKKGNWMLSTGLGVLSLREKTNYITQKEAYTYTTAPRIVNGEYTTTPRGTRVALVSQTTIDSTLVSTTSNACNDCNVSFNYVSVPLSLQYNFGKSRLRYFAEAGVTASFLQNAKGDYALPEVITIDSVSQSNGVIVDLTKSEDVSKMLLQANAAVGVKFWLTPRWNLWTSYGYGMGLNSMLSTYEQKPTLQNLRVGVEFKLR